MKKISTLTALAMVLAMLAVFPISPIGAASDGLVAYWPMNDGSGPTVAEVVNGNDGTLQGDANFSTNIPPMPGNVTSVFLDGTGDLVLVLDPASGDLDFNGAFTIGAWINLPDLFGVHEIVSKLDNTPSANSAAYELVVLGTELRGTVYDNSECGPGGGCETYISRKAVEALSTGWHHVAMVYDGGTTTSAIKLYVDGAQADNTDLIKGNFTAIEDVSADVMIGANTKADGTIGNFFNGHVDEVRIYGRALSVDEIKSLLLTGTVGTLFVDFDGEVGYGPFACDGGGVPVYDKIQDAVDAASDGDTIKVCPATYDDHVRIDGTDLSLIAIGSVQIAPSVCTIHGDVIQVSDAEATISGFEIDASNCESGIYARGCSWLGEESVSVAVQNNHVWGYNKNGITVNCDMATGTVVDNMVEGAGALGSVAQNGIQFGYGATGQVMRNTVDGHWYTGEDWSASGILVFEADEVIVQRNTVLNNQTGIAIETWCWYEPSASYNRVVANTINEANWGISVAAYDWEYSGCASSSDNNKVVNNVITTSVGDTGISIGSWDLNLVNTFTPTTDNNKVIHNDISGYTTDIDDSGTTSKVHANILEP